MREKRSVAQEVPIAMLETLPLWQLDIAEVTGHNLEARGREEVNRLLQSGWRLLHVYTLKYQEAGVWRERPMAILGRSKASTCAEIFPIGRSAAEDAAETARHKEHDHGLQ